MSSSGSDKERETFVYMAKLSEQAERYDGNIISLLFSILIARIYRKDLVMNVQRWWRR